MTAREMFEELNFEQIRNDDNYIEYVRNGLGGYISILFSLRWKTIKSTCGYQARGINYHEITLDELKAIIQQAKELHWLDEKTEIKEARNPEVTNFEYYKDEILENCLEDLAVVKGRPKLCYKTSCNDCDFKLDQKGCHNKVKDWLKQTHKKPTYKLTKFEKELLECYSDVYSFKVFNSLNGMKEKGYFKGIDDNELIGDILAKCEVVG